MSQSEYMLSVVVMALCCCFPAYGATNLCPSTVRMVFRYTSTKAYLAFVERTIISSRSQAEVSILPPHHFPRYLQHSLVGMVQHWILKSQPAEYSVTDLQRTGTGCWNEVRNYQARNLMQEMKDHDTAFFYHSGCPDAGIYGLMNITSGPYPDETARHKGSKYFDQRAADGNNPWVCVDVELVRRYQHPLLIPQLNALGLEYHPKRLSVIKISDEQFERIKAELEAHNRT